MDFRVPAAASKPTLRTLVVTGSVVLTGLIAGGVVKYRDRLRDRFHTSNHTSTPAPGTAYEEWTKADLYERAREKDISGRSTMNKEELIEALRTA